MKLPGQLREYRGFPQRAWMRIRLQSLEDEIVEMDAMIDTGCPYSIVLDDRLFERFMHRYIKSVESNFGLLAGGWLRAIVPGTRLNADVVGYGSSTILRLLHASDRRFEGLIGLPLLRMLEYGGDATRFWIRDSSR